MDSQHQSTPAANESKSVTSKMILRGDSILPSAALKLARHVKTKGLRRGSEELVELVLELVKSAESACESPLICPANMHNDRNFQDPVLYADSLVLLAGTWMRIRGERFGCVHPTKYLPFLQQVAGDLMNH